MDGDTVPCSTDTGAPTTFQLERHINVAIKMLALDPNLAKIHARLISNMPEKIFWQNYFSRIATFREEVGIEPLCEDISQVRIYREWPCFSYGLAGNTEHIDTYVLASTSERLP